MNRSFSWNFLLAGTVLVCGMTAWSAEKTKVEQAEEAEAAEEDRKLQEAGRIPEDGYEFMEGGKLHLAAGVMDPARPSVLGIFRSNKRTYQVKVAEESLRPQLAKFNGKMVTLGGKIRNGGKYLIVQEVLSRPGRLAPASNTSPLRM
jgi:hypothetical protein